MAEAMDITPAQVFVEDNLPLLREFAIMAQRPAGRPESAGHCGNHAVTSTPCSRAT